MVSENLYGRRKIREGVVVSDKMDKTVVVAIETHSRHRLYKKIMRHVTRYKAHDEDNSCQAGDRVRIVEARPFSKEKRWRVIEIVRRSGVLESVGDEDQGPGARHQRSREAEAALPANAAVTPPGVAAAEATAAISEEETAEIEAAAEAPLEVEETAEAGEGEAAAKPAARKSAAKKAANADVNGSTGDEADEGQAAAEEAKDKE